MTITNTIRILIVDDEPLARVGVVERLRAHSDLEVVGECENAAEARSSLASLHPDVIFLDIRMPDATGIQLLNGIPLEDRPAIVFLTAHEEYALDAFACEALDYLLKPIDEERFATCIDRVRRLLLLKQHAAYAEKQDRTSQRLPESNDEGFVHSFIVRQGTSVRFIRTSEIDWIEGLGNYAGLHVGPHTYLIRETFGTIASRLNPAHFLRIHRSHIIQLNRIVQVASLTNRDLIVTLRGGTEVRGSRNYTSKLQAILRNGLVASR